MVEGSFVTFGQYTFWDLRQIRVVEVFHRSELQTQRVREPDRLLTRWAPTAGDLQFSSLCGGRQGLASPPEVRTLRGFEEDLPPPRSLLHHGAFDGLTGPVHVVEILSILQPRVGRRQAPEQPGDAAVVPG